MEQMASEMTKQKTELLQFRENTERKTTDTLLILNKENESVCASLPLCTSCQVYRKN